MTTFTWASGAVADWTDPNAWQIDFVSPAGPPGAGDTASIVVGTIDLEMPLHDIQIVMQPVQGLTAEIVATNVELGDNVVLTADSAGSSVLYKVVGTGTLDDGNRTDGLAPQAGSIISNVLNFVLVAGGSGSSTFINEGIDHRRLAGNNRRPQRDHGGFRERCRDRYRLVQHPGRRHADRDRRDYLR